MIQSSESLWNDLKVPNVDGLIFDQEKYLRLVYKVSYISPAVYTLIVTDCFLSNLNDVWDGNTISHVDILQSRKMSEGWLYVGETDYGSQGFAAYESDDKLQWILFLQRSNPFVEINTVAGNDKQVVICSSLMFGLTIDLDHPEQSFVVSSDTIGRVGKPEK